MGYRIHVDDMNVIIVYFKNSVDGSDEHDVLLTTKAGNVTIPASVIARRK